MSMPAFRFKNDDGRDFPEWEYVPIGNKVKEKSPKFNPDKQSKIMNCIELEHLSQSTGELLGYTDTSNSKSTKNKFDKGDILFGKLRPYLRKYLKAPFDGVCSTEIWVLKGNEISNEYLFQFIQTDGFMTQANISAGSKMPRADWNVISSSYAYFPKPDEQIKIANFLTAVDEKITQLTQKCELLAQYKKGVMQQIFSQELRFKDDDGQEFPEWEELQADEVFVNVTNKNHNGELPILAATQDKGMIYREESGLDIKSSEASVKSYKIVESGDFVISLRSFQGGIEYSSLKGICSPAYTVMKPKLEISDGFFKAYLKKDDFIERLNGLVIGIRDGKQISYSAFATLTLPYPCIKEQIKIANFLTAIDDKLTHTQAQLEAAKQYKQGLLQQMFV
jgi:type I restriction enzyme S subunit